MWIEYYLYRCNIGNILDRKVFIISLIIYNIKNIIYVKNKNELNYLIIIINVIITFYIVSIH